MHFFQNPLTAKWREGGGFIERGCLYGERQYHFSPKVYYMNNPQPNHGICRIVPWFEVVNTKEEACGVYCFKAWKNSAYTMVLAGVIPIQT